MVATIARPGEPHTLFTTHLKRPDGPYSNSACGHYYYSPGHIALTSDPSRVSCLLCRRTHAFKRLIDTASPNK